MGRPDAPRISSCLPERLAVPIIAVTLVTVFLPFPPQTFPVVDAIFASFLSRLVDDSGIVRILDRDRFPPPWTVEEQAACFVLRDRNGHALAHVYFEDDRAGSARELLTPKAARRIAAQLAELPNLLRE